MEEKQSISLGSFAFDGLLKRRRMKFPIINPLLLYKLGFLHLQTKITDEWEVVQQT